MAEELEVTDSDTKSSAKRRRLKGLLKKIQEQVEFYLGDANLPKDKFLQEKAKQHPDGCISLELIASFNKMKAITSDLSLVIQAVQHSTILQLSEDKKWVKRATPLPVSSDVDHRTVYIENLPKNASHDFVRNSLKRFGTISYISLPRHKNSTAIKGFAFVEFSTSQEAQDAVMFFKTLQLPTVTPAQQMEVTNEEGTVPITSELTKEEGTVPITAEVTKEEGTVPITSEVTKVEGTVPITAEVTEEEGSTVPITSDVAEEEGTVPITTEVTSQGAVPITSEVTSQGGVPITSEVTSHLTPCNSTQQTMEEAPEDRSMVDLRELPIKEHQEDGNKVAISGSEDTLQIAGVKRSRDVEGEEACPKRRKVGSGVGAPEGGVAEGGVAEGELPSCGETEEVEGGEKGSKRKRSRKKKKQPGLKELNLRVMSKVEWLEMKHLFAQMQKEQLRKLKAAVSMAPAGGKEKPKGFVPHTLVKVVCSGTVTAQTLKELCMQYGKVAYVDFSDGDKEGYIRFATSGCVEKLLACQPPQDVSLQAVDEDGERAYYLKSQAARKQHRLHNIKKKHIRGKEKVISKALQKQVAARPNPPTSQSIHLRFSDDEESADAQ